jgi:NADPH2:quinone reductase
MKAVALTHYLPLDQPESLFDTELPVPLPQGRDLLVAVQAVSVNPLDLRVRRPKDKVEATPRVLGWDAAGIVTAVGPEVSMFKPGDAVFYAGDLSRNGSNSEFQLVDERLAAAKPSTLSFAQAAVLPLSALTAWEALFDRLAIPVAKRVGPLPVPANKTILVIGAAGGVGSMAVQLAAHVAGLTVIATASRPESQLWVRKMGAHHVIDHYGDMAGQLQAIGIKEVDLILMLADTDAYFDVAAALIAPQGRICTAVEASRPVNYAQLWDKSVTLVWEMVFTRLEYPGQDLVRYHQILASVAQLVDEGILVSTLTDILAPINASNVRLAHATLAANRTLGKIALAGFHD